MSGPELIARVYSRLVELDCDPQISPDGRTIVATCPCCREPHGFEMTIPDGKQEQIQ